MGPASPRHSRERGNPELARAQLLPLDPRFRGGDGKRLGRRDPFKSGSQSRKPSGGPGDLVQQMKEQAGRERRARPVLDHDLASASELELAEHAGRRRSYHRLQGHEASGSGGVAGIGSDHRSRGSVHLDFLLNDRAPSHDAEDAENFDYLFDHLTSKSVGWPAWRPRLSSVDCGLAFARLLPPAPPRNVAPADLPG